MDGFWEPSSGNGASRNPYRAGFLQFVGVADSDAEAERLYAEPALYFYNRCLHLYPGFTNPPGRQRRWRPSARAWRARCGRGRRKADPSSTWKDIVDRGYVVAGSATRSSIGSTR